MGLGEQLERALLYAFDEAGEPIAGRATRSGRPPAAVSGSALPVRETRGASGGGDHGYAAREVLSRRADRLTADEAEALRLQSSAVGVYCGRRSVRCGDLHLWLRRGYVLASAESGGYVDVEGDEPVHLTYAEVGERMGATPERVHALLRRARAKMRGDRT